MRGRITLSYWAEGFGTNPAAGWRDFEFLRATARSDPAARLLE
jgi:hypothetical protein